MTDDALIEAMAREALKAFALASGLGIFPDDEQDEDWREDLVNGMKAALAAVRPVIRAQALEEAAKACEAIEDQLDTQWRGGLKVCSYTEGASDGANDCAAAIRALKEQDT